MLGVSFPLGVFVTSQKSLKRINLESRQPGVRLDAITVDLPCMQPRLLCSLLVLVLTLLILPPVRLFPVQARLASQEWKVVECLFSDSKARKFKLLSGDMGQPQILLPTDVLWYCSDWQGCLQLSLPRCAQISSLNVKKSEDDASEVSYRREAMLPFPKPPLPELWLRLCKVKRSRRQNASNLKNE